MIGRSTFLVVTILTFVFSTLIGAMGADAFAQLLIGTSSQMLPPKSWLNLVFLLSWETGLIIGAAGWFFGINLPMNFYFKKARVPFRWAAQSDELSRAFFKWYAGNMQRYSDILLGEAQQRVQADRP